MSVNEIPEPWKSFLGDVDNLLQEEVSLHCIGGFVVVEFYGCSRGTADLDYMGMVPTTEREKLLAQARAGSALHDKHGVYLDYASVAAVPENYEDRLQPMYEGAFERLRLFALDPYDLLLAKASRNIERDREDLKCLAKTQKLNPETLASRYESEMRSVGIGIASHVSKTIELWVEIIREVQAQTSSS